MGKRPSVRVNGTRALGVRARIAAGIAAALLVAGCSPASTNADTAVTAVTITSTAAAAQTTGAPGTNSAVVVPPLPGSSPTAGSGSPGTTDAATSATPSVTITSPPPKPQAKPATITASPADKTDEVDPLAKVVVRSAGGKLTSVAMTNPDGKKLPGKLSPDGMAWQAQNELGYGRTYTLKATARNIDGRLTTLASTFTTVDPASRASVSVFPRPGATVGVGQPIAFYFDTPIEGVEAKRFVEKQITVSAAPQQEGTFRWFTNTEVHWRPKVFWKAGTKVSVKIKIYGKELSDGVYGAEDRNYSFKIGRKLIATVDDKTKTMVVTRDDKVIKTIPVSLGSDKYPSYNGVHVVAEKYQEKIMDSRTWGLEGDGAYRTKVKWATRISSSGEFVHGAPWSEWAQGSENVSHGCVNMTDAAAQWFYTTFNYGDVVTIKNTSGPQLQEWDGFGDWQVPYADY